MEPTYDYDALAEEAYDAGVAAGTWMFDGNTDAASYERVLCGFNEGDPEIMDMQPSPLSGEWADAPTPATIQRDWNIPDEEIDEACDLYEEAYSRGFWDEVTRSAAASLPDES